MANQKLVCPPTPQKKLNRSTAPRKYRENVVADYVGKISPKNPLAITFGKEHENPDLSGKIIQIENTDIMIYVYDLSKDSINMFNFAAEIRRNREILFSNYLLETSNINPFYRGNDLHRRFKSFKIQNGHGEYINFPFLIASNVTTPLHVENGDAKRLKSTDNEDLAASSADLEWRNRTVPISLMFASPDKDTRADDQQFKTPAPIKPLFK